MVVRFVPTEPQRQLLPHDFILSHTLHSGCFLIPDSVPRGLIISADYLLFESGHAHSSIFYFAELLSLCFSVASFQLAPQSQSSADLCTEPVRFTEGWARVLPGSLSLPPRHVCLPAFFFVLSSFFRAAPEACGGSQARDQIRVVAPGLHHGHSKARSEPRLRPLPQLTARSDP